MIVERIWTGNSYRNYNYLIACPETGEALADAQIARRVRRCRQPGTQIDHAGHLRGEHFG